MRTAWHALANLFRGSDLKIGVRLTTCFLTIVVLMIAVGLSYRQLIRAYPHGGGSYIVAARNLGELDPPRWSHLLTASHPTPRERIAAARAAAEGIAALQRGEVRVQALQHLHAERVTKARR